jgi:predicted PurR-regulated permease PerM
MLIERSMLLLLLAGLLTCAVLIVRPFATAILFGGAIAIAAWPLRQALVRRGVRRAFAATLLFVLSVMVILLPLLAIAPRVADQSVKAVQQFESFFHAAPEMPVWISALPIVGRRLGAAWDLVVEAQGSLNVLIAPYTGDLERFLVLAVAALASSFIQILLSLLAAAMFWAHGDELVRVLHDALDRLGGPVAEQAIDVAAGAVRGVVYGVIGTAGIQAIILAVGLAAAGVPAAAMLGFIALLLAISQIGAPLLILIWGGAAWWLFRQDASGWGTFMIIWGVFVSTVDNLIRPWLIGVGINMPLSLTVLGVFGGFVVFGFLGLFVGPTLLSIAYTLFMAWRSAVAVHPATSIS